MVEKILIKGQREKKGKFRVTNQKSKPIFFDDIECAMSYAKRIWGKIEKINRGEWDLLITGKEIEKYVEANDTLYSCIYKVKGDIYKCSSCEYVYVIKDRIKICPICKSKLKLILEVEKW